MADIFTWHNLTALGLLILLQAVLGFDNLLYISLASKNAPVDRRAAVRRWGIGIAVGLRIVLLFLLIQLISWFQNPIFEFADGGWISGSFHLHSLIVLLGGVFIIYTSVREIWHMIGLEDLEVESRQTQSAARVIFTIVVMNLVFSFDSILSAMALSDVFWVMATAILVGGLLMILLADRVSGFLNRNRMYEVLGLFILFIVGIMLVTEGGHLAELRLFGEKIMPMTKTTFYFVLSVLILTDVVQGRYRKRLLKLQALSRD